MTTRPPDHRRTQLREDEPLAIEWTVEYPGGTVIKLDGPPDFPFHADVIELLFTMMLKDLSGSAGQGLDPEPEPDPG